MTVFVVDANQTDLACFGNHIRDVCPGAVIRLFDDPEQALCAAEKSKPDYLFTDAQLGSRDGIGFAKKIRDKYPSVLLTIMSDSVDYAISAWEMHADGFLIKPITSTKLRQNFKAISAGGTDY